MGQQEKRPHPYARGVTLSDLRSQQHSLNMQMLLAIQVHDEAEQTRLAEEQASLQDRIDQLCLREYRHK